MGASRINAMGLSALAWMPASLPEGLRNRLLDQNFLDALTLTVRPMGLPVNGS